jgi:hypothetical protein
MKDRRLQMDETEEKGMEPQLTPKKPKGQAALGRDIQAKIGLQLRSYYDSLVEPTPDRFAELLKQLDKSNKEPTE